MSWNAAAERLFGYTAEEAIGQSITIVIPKERLSEETEVHLADPRRARRSSTTRPSGSTRTATASTFR